MRDNRETSLGRSLATSDVSNRKLSAHSPLSESGLVWGRSRWGDARGRDAGEELVGEMERAGGEWRGVEFWEVVSGVVERSVEGIEPSLPSSFTLREHAG